MIRFLLILALLAGGPALAQAPAPQAPAPQPQPTAQTAAPAVTPEQARAALSVLRDDARRAEMIGVLDAIARAAPAAPAEGAPKEGAVKEGAAAPAEKPLPIPLVPDSVGAQVLLGVSGALIRLTGELSDTVRAVNDLPLLLRWAQGLATDPVSQAALLDAGWKLLVVLAAGLAVEAGVRWLLRRPRAALIRRAPGARPGHDPEPETAVNPLAEAEAGQTERLHRRAPALLLLKRLPLGLGVFVLDLIPVIAFVTVAHGALTTPLITTGTTALVVLGLTDAYALCRVSLSVVRLLLAPEHPRLRLVTMGDAGAIFVMRWTRRILAVAIFGYATAEVALAFGLYRVAHDALLKIVSLAVVVMLSVVVLRIRRRVARRIRAPAGATGGWAGLRDRLAEAWHVIAIFYLFALWLVWALEIRDGLSRLLYVVISAIVARLLSILLLGMLDRALGVGDPARASSPWLVRARTYRAPLRAAIHVAVMALTAILLLQLWGLNPLGWMVASALGTRLMGALASMALTLLVALLAWEAANAAIERHLVRLAQDAQAARSARLRTLLPMLRTVLLVAIALLAGLMVLSEIGINTAPLLAGAGVLGIAIGFGSQKLVQDIITGLFLLLENAMQVGDVVTLGGLSGTVEALSVRAIKLRALDGAVHLIPFSAVTTVTNMTRDFGFAVIDVSVGLNEDPDDVSAAIRDVARTMRSEPRWAGAMRDELEVLGVDRFLDNALVLRTRVKTVPGQRWAVGRELNLRIKQRFDRDAIESPWTSHRVLATPPPVMGPSRPADTGG